MFLCKGLIEIKSLIPNTLERCMHRKLEQSLLIICIGQKTMNLAIGDFFGKVRDDYIIPKLYRLFNLKVLVK